MNKLLMSIFAVLLLGLTLTAVQAQNLGATSVIMSGEPGDAVTGTTTVVNDAGSELNLHIETIKLVGETDPSEKIPADFISVSPESFILEDGELRTVQITIDIDDNLPEQIYSGEFTAVATDGTKTTFNVLVDVKSNIDSDQSFNFQDIEVDGVDVLDDDEPTGQTVFVERGDTIPIRTEFTSDINSDKVRVKTWIGGFEFGDVADDTEIFTVETGLVYVKTLSLEIPDDIDLDEDEFTLHVEVFDNDGIEREETFKLGIRKERHDLSILDVIFFPSNTVEAGRPLTTEVRVENLGEQKEEDVLVRVSIPELGISAKTFIDELVPDENGLFDDDEETSDSTDDLILFIPDDASTGTYTVEVEVEFNRGHDVITETRSIFVEGSAPGSPTNTGTVDNGNILVSVDMSAQNIAQGSESGYKIMIANLGNKNVLYSVQTSDISAWGSSRVSPAFVTVGPGQAGELFVFVTANDNAMIGQQHLTVNILADGQIIKQLTLNANIQEKSSISSSIGAQKGLEIAFILLVIVLIILGLVIAFRRIGNRSENTAGETESVEGQTYY